MYITTVEGQSKSTLALGQSDIGCHTGALLPSGAALSQRRAGS